MEQTNLTFLDLAPDSVALICSHFLPLESILALAQCCKYLLELIRTRDDIWQHIYYRLDLGTTTGVRNIVHPLSSHCGKLSYCFTGSQKYCSNGTHFQHPVITICSESRAERTPYAVRRQMRITTKRVIVDYGIIHKKRISFRSQCLERVLRLGIKSFRKLFQLLSTALNQYSNKLWMIGIRSIVHNLFRGVTAHHILSTGGGPNWDTLDLSEKHQPLLIDFAEAGILRGKHGHLQIYDYYKPNNHASTSAGFIGPIWLILGEHKIVRCPSDWLSLIHWGWHSYSRLYYLPSGEWIADHCHDQMPHVNHYVTPIKIIVFYFNNARADDLSYLLQIDTLSRKKMLSSEDKNENNDGKRNGTLVS